MRTLVLLTLLGATTQQSAFAQPKAPEPKIVAAIDGILDVFGEHPVVALGDAHGMAQEEDFYAALVRSPRFAAEVRNVVVEFGDAAQQPTLDRYLSGEDVPYPELRKVWADTVGWLPTVTSLGYINFYAQVREVNRKLKPEQQIHVWLGDPAVNWAQVNTIDDLPKDSRDKVPAEILEKLLAKHEKALLIYGTGHFYGSESIKARVEQHYPNAVFFIHPYSGFQEEACSTSFETLLPAGKQSLLISPVRGSALEARLKTPGCHVLPPNPTMFPPDYSAEKKAHLLAVMEDQQSGVAADALLYLGPAGTLTQSQESPDLYMDADFRKEIVRRAEIMLGRSLTNTPVNIVPVSPRFIKPYGGAPLR
jgi:hypothetical protein